MEKIKTLDALLIADGAMTMGESFIDALKSYKRETISREELLKILELPDFNSFSQKASEEDQ